MKTRRIFIIVFVMLFVLGLMTGCGAKSESAMDAPAAEAPMESPVMDMESGELSSSMEAGQAELPANEKIITTLYLNAQTEDMDTILRSVNEKIAEVGGYIEGQDIYNGSAYESYRYRHATLTIRIPADKLTGFVAHVSANANIISENTTTENITLSYVAVESRIEALEAERDRLMELMAMAEDMEDLLMIEARLTEVLAELEEVTSQLRLYDNLVNYSTVHLDIEEVKEFTEVEEEPETVWERIANGFTKNLKKVGENLVDFFVGLIVILPHLLPWSAAAAVVVIIIVRSKRKRRARRAAMNAQQNETE
jgi:hypothetical protein